MHSRCRKKIGIVAGRGIYPILVAQEAREKKVDGIYIVAVIGDADPFLETIADKLQWVYAGQLNKAISFFKKEEVKHVIFAGQIKPTRLFSGLRPDFRGLKLLGRLAIKSADSIFSAVAEEFLKDNIKVLPATTFLEKNLVPQGVVGKIKPGKRLLQDIAFGKSVALGISSMNIGQTVVVKKGIILAVEAFEGTDKAIIRGGEIGKGKVTVVKIANRNQDMRFDVPCIGMRTIESLQSVQAKALALEAEKTLLLEKDAVITALNHAKIALVGISITKDDLTIAKTTFLSSCDT